ncbi:YihY/virulence factor BrkB family protein [Candidatus Entotheonella palauensis]|nr:YihY/virulence factor BrkB family protein [Candidatus Entotheonella palauensis]
MPYLEDDESTRFTSVQIYYQRLRNFILHDLWALELTALSVAKQCLLYPLQVILIALRGFFFEHQCVLRSAALSYTTLLALVPMLAFIFAFLKGLGVQNKLEPWLIQQISPGSEETIQQIIAFVNNVEVGTLGVISLGTLLFSTLLQLRTVEQSLNAIWHVTEEKPLIRKISDYVSVFMLAPVVIVLAISAGSQPLVEQLQDLQLIGPAVGLLITLLPSVLIWLVISFFYFFVPNAQVRFVPALVGGFIGSTLYLFAKAAYINLQVLWWGKYEVIYGALAQLPILMIWLYLSWVIILLGAEIAHACQSVTSYPLGRFAAVPSPSTWSATSIYIREWLANMLYFSLLESFTAGAGPWSAANFAQQHRLPMRLVRELTDILTQAGVIVEVARAPEHYVPGRDPSQLTPGHILQILRHAGDEAVSPLIQQSPSPATALMERVEAAIQQVSNAHPMPYWLSAKEPAHLLSRAEIEEEDKM